MSDKIFHYAAYMRLSREDGDGGESNSITNQRLIIKDFAGSRGVVIEKEYIDDGYTGSNFDRPGFKALLEAIKNNRINAIIVKDLSRFGRNATETGRYLENLFPVWGVRLIAINDFYDTELKNGSFGNDVKYIQVWLNRISGNFPAIPKIPAADGIFDSATEAAVRKFQQVFGLEVTGVVNAATWYRITYIYTSVKRLAELDSEGVRFEEISPQFAEELRIGMQSIEVSMLQYYLAVIGAYYEAVIPVEITGYFGEQTERSVKSFQRVFGLPQTGVVDRATRNDLYRAYEGIAESVPSQYTAVALYPGTVLREGARGDSVRTIQQYLTYINRSYPDIPAVSDTGYFGPLTRQSVTAFQRQFGIDPSGIVGAVTWDRIAGVYSDLRFGFDKRPYQNPGYTIK